MEKLVVGLKKAEMVGTEGLSVVFSRPSVGGQQFIVRRREITVTISVENSRQKW